MADLKKLQELYAEYKKICMSEGGETKASKPVGSDKQSRMEKVPCYDDGGEVKQPNPIPSIDPEKAKSAQDSMRKAFGFSEGGEVTPKPGKKSLNMPEMKPIMSSDEKVIDTLHHIVKGRKGYTDGGLVDNQMPPEAQPVDPGFQAFMQQNPNLDPSFARTAYQYKMSQGGYRAPASVPTPTQSPNPYMHAAEQITDPNRMGYNNGGEVGYYNGEEVQAFSDEQDHEDELRRQQEINDLNDNSDELALGLQNQEEDQISREPGQENIDFAEPSDVTVHTGPYPGEEEDAQKAADMSTDGSLDTNEGLNTQDMDIRHQPGKIAENVVKKQESQPIPEQDSPTSEAKSGQNPEGKTQNTRQLEGMTLNKNEIAPDENSAIQNLVNASKGQQNALRDAQAQRDSNIAGQQLMKGAALFSAGKLKTSPEQSLKVIGENDRYVGLPVEKYSENIANQKNDPNSPMTKAVEQYLSSKGINPINGASAQDYLTYMPYLQKDQSLKAAMEKAQLGIKSREGIAEASRVAADLRNQRSVDATKESAKMRADAMKAGQDKSQTRQSQRIAGQLVNRVQTDPIIKPSIQNLASLHKSKALLENKGLPLTPQVLADAEQDISSALTLRGMGATEGKIKRTELNTVGRMMAEAKQKYLNQPDIDLRKEEPALVAQIYKTNKALIDDYDVTIAERKDDLAKEYETAYGDDPKLKKVVDQYKKKKIEINADDQKALDHFKALPDTDPNKEMLGNILKGKGLL